MTEQKDDFIKIQDIISICIKSWRWFLFSLIAALCIAILYILVTPAKYSRQASLLVKEESKGSSTIANESSPFSDFGFYNVNTNVNNEIIAIKSPALVYETVKRLHLELEYKTKGFFKDNTLYGETLPINVIIDGLQDKEFCSFTVSNDNGNYEISDININGLEFDKSLKCKIGETVKANKCLITIIKSPFYNSDFSEDIYITRRTILNASDACQNKLTVRLNDDKASIINLNYEDVNIERAEDFLNTLISVYNESWVKDKNQIAISTSRFINERLDVIEQELGNVDNDISSYKSTHLIPDVEAASNMYMNQANETNTKILNLDNQLTMAKYVYNFVKNENNNSQLLPANMGIGSDNIETQISEYNSLLLQKNRLIANSGAQNPYVADLSHSISAMRNAIITSIENQINSLETQIKSFRKSEQHNTEKIASNPTQAKYLLSVERQQKVKEALYLYLLQKREENELSQAFTAYNTRIITPPMGPMEPSQPIKRNIFLIAIIAGLMLPLVIIVLKENLNTKIRDKNDVESISIPFVGEIPQIGPVKNRLHLFRREKDDYKYTKIYVTENGKDLINESFRIVRTNLEFINGQNNNKTIMVTSATPENGKTFITLNLAASFAIKKKKTIIVDLDLRRSSLSKCVGTYSCGISSYLNGSVKDWREIISTKNAGSQRIDIIPVGIIPPNPTELLYSPLLEELISNLKAEYDLILMDCPPIDIVADTSIISKHADSTLFVIRAEFVDKDLLPAIEKFYNDKRFKDMSYLLNGVDVSNADSSYSRYGYRYGYEDYT